MHAKKNTRIKNLKELIFFMFSGHFKIFYHIIALVVVINMLLTFSYDMH